MSGARLRLAAALSLASPAPPSDGVRTASGRVVPVADVDRFVAAQMEALGVPGLSLAVVNDGEVVYHRALGVADVGTGAPVTGAHVFEAASLSKPVFAAYVLRLVEDRRDRPRHPALHAPPLRPEFVRTTRATTR